MCPNVANDLGRLDHWMVWHRRRNHSNRTRLPDYRSHHRLDSFRHKIANQTWRTSSQTSIWIWKRAINKVFNRLTRNPDKYPNGLLNRDSCDHCFPSTRTRYKNAVTGRQVCSLKLAPPMTVMKTISWPAWNTMQKLVCDYRFFDCFLDSFFLIIETYIRELNKEIKCFFPPNAHMQLL